MRHDEETGTGHDDVEKEEMKKLEHEVSSSEDEEQDALPRRPPPAVHSRHPEVVETGGNIEDALHFGTAERHASRSSHGSQDSARTASDVHDPHIHHSTSRTQSRARSRAQSSVRSIQRIPVKVPVAQRRGLLARFAVIAEVTDAKDYSRSLKWIITTIVAAAGAASPMGTSILLPALPDIALALHSTLAVVNLSVAMYLLAMGIFPLWWSSFSETLGRRTIYITSFILFVLFNVLSAVSPNIGMFIAMRVLSGGAAASVQAVGAGTIADMWEVKERGKAMGFFYLGPLCGPLLSPIIGGALTETLGWRSPQWFMAIFGFCLLLMIVFCLPETLARRRQIRAEAEEEAVAVASDTNEKGVTESETLARTTTKASVKVKTTKYLVMLRRAFLDPLRIVLYLQFPAVAFSVFYASTTLASLYFLNISISELFSGSPYNYGSIIIGCLYLPNSVGYFLSSVLGGRWVDYIMHREARKAGRYDENGRLQFRPEDRMKENAWLGAILYPSALIAYGWCAQYRVTVAGAMVANFFFGIGSMIIFAVTTTMLTEYMPRKSSNGVAVNNFVRMIFSCIGTIVAEPLIKAIGNGWLFTGLGVIALVTGVITVAAMKRYGDRWRVTMDRKLDSIMKD